MPIWLPPRYDFSQSATAVTFTMPAWWGTGMASLIGSYYGDVLHGSDAGESISGWYGDDYVDGRGGNDLIGGGFGQDTLRGGDGSDNILGGVGNDTLHGDAGSDGLNGEAGDDRLHGGADSDYLFGGEGFDELWGEDGADHLDGGDWADILRGGLGADALFGGGWDDDLDGQQGDDHLEGGEGNDLMKGGDGADSFIGGAGADDIRGDDAPLLWSVPQTSDTARYIDSWAGVEITLTSASHWISYTSPRGVTYWREVVEGFGAGSGGDAAGDTFYSIENIDGSNHSDELTGNLFNNIFLGLDGDDRLDGGAGADTLHGGYNDDVIQGGDGDDVIHGGGILARQIIQLSIPYWPSGPTQNVTPAIIDITDFNEREWWRENGADTLSGGAGSDTIFGGAGNDTLVGGEGENRMYGGDGKDLFIAGRDAEIIDGDVRYENYRGTQLHGGPGSHALFAADALNDDTVSYAGSSASIKIIFSLYFTDYVFTQDNGNGTASTFIPLYGLQVATGIGGHADGDQLYSIEHVVGTDFADEIVGTSLIGNRFEGSGGDDILIGNGGGDTLIGGTGFDTLRAGAGYWPDAFIYNSVWDAPASIAYKGGMLPPNFRVERIEAFESGKDRIDLSAIDADENSWPFNDAFVTVGGFSGFSGVAGELLIEAVDTTPAGDYVYAVAGDTSGDGIADMLIRVEMTGGLKLQATDFIL